MKNRQAFSMLEIIVVMVIVGMIALMAVPSYLRAQQRAVERGIADNLDVIWQAVLNYRIRQGAFPSGLANVTVINSTLNLYIVDDGATYSCSSVAGKYECVGDPTAYTWDLHVRERHESERPHGNNGTLPTCNITASLHCPWITYPYSGDI